MDADRDVGTPAGLGALRRHRGLTQRKVAESAGVTQPAIAQLEASTNPALSSVVRYVRATGGRLRLLVEYPSGQPVELDLDVLDVRPRREFWVIWQDPGSRTFVRVANLVDLGLRYELEYTDEGRTHPGFNPFPGLDDLNAVHRADDLFACFADRAVESAGTDLASALGLRTSEATPVELLTAHAPGGSTADPHVIIQVVPAPQLRGDHEVMPFFASGVRHVLRRAPDQARADSVLGRVQQGAKVELRREPGNRVNPKAVRLLIGRTEFGYLPDYLTGYVETAQREGRTPAVTITRVNPLEVHPHVRVLCDLRVPAPDRAGRSALS